MKLFILTFFCVLTLNLSAQIENYKPDRDSYPLTIAVNKKSTYQSDIKASPYVVGADVLQLYAGETVFVEVEQSNGVVNRIKTVKENKNPEKTLEISFLQNANKKTHVNMMLKISNPFKMDLSYSAKIFLMTHNTWVNTNVLPVKAGLSSIEMWPDVIVSIGLADWTFKQ